MTTGDYGGYGEILREARKIEDEGRRREEKLCPVCGNVLTVNARGVRNCDVGHYRSDGPGAQ